jgi:hypothetical protein
MSAGRIPHRARSRARAAKAGRASPAGLHAEVQSRTQELPAAVPTQQAGWYYQNIRLDHDDVAELRARAKRERTSVAELIRRYVTWGLEDDYRGDRE